jgi:hypothetical protein
VFGAGGTPAVDDEAPLLLVNGATLGWEAEGTGGKIVADVVGHDCDGWAPTEVADDP